MMYVRSRWAQALVVILLVQLNACTPAPVNQPAAVVTPGAGTNIASSAHPTASIVADVISVEVSGNPGDYSFDVEIASPDENCFQYADWWEVIDEDGHLLYRRVLDHSHVDEQPFTRSGGPVPIEPGATVWVRAHMNIGGYGGAAMKGSVQAGFRTAELSADFAADLANQAPLPQDCAF